MRLDYIRLGESKMVNRVKKFNQSLDTAVKVWIEQQFTKSKEVPKKSNGNEEKETFFQNS